tara:strand:+ start:1133 stop:1267 length:135 start_codon:yes stop_codon:yes gene_type:complete
VASCENESWVLQPKKVGNANGGQQKKMKKNRDRAQCKFIKKKNM